MIKLRSYRRIQKKEKITHGSLWIPTTLTNRTSRWRAAAAAPLHALVRSEPLCSREVAGQWIRRSCTLERQRRREASAHHLLLQLRHPDPPPMQIRRGTDVHGGSNEPRARGRRALRPGAPQSTTAEGDEHRHQTPHRPRHRLHNAAERPPPLLIIKSRLMHNGGGDGNVNIVHEQTAFTMGRVPGTRQQWTTPCLICREQPPWWKTHSYSQPDPTMVSDLVDQC